ncbi:hypothetical protein [Verminephrobacter aporrectodeae]|uniref:hypothetical protein n=1 Tax=Verminephrobacter aporrectodeae TaxID=1110389 RepID=UPI002238BC1F|nr:hypothetical protein [Verminephrobacter aporrectodeae]
MDTDDYPDAAKRHLHDAQLLLAEVRLANASHLSGLSVECALKAIARHHTPSACFRGGKGHLPKLFSELKNVAPNMTAHVASEIVALERWFTDWDVVQRYVPQALFESTKTSQQCAAAHGAHLLMRNCLGGLV